MSQQYSKTTILLSVGVAFVEGAFSFVGMQVLLNDLNIFSDFSKSISISAAIFCVSIEGEIFLQNTHSALNYYSQNETLRQKIARNILVDYCNDNLACENDFINQYRNLYLATQRFSDPTVLDLEGQNQYKADKAKQDEIENLLIEYFSGNNQLQNYKYMDTVFSNMRAEFLSEVYMKNIIINLFHAVNIAAVIGEYLSSLYVAQQFLLIFHLAGLPLFLGANIIAIIAGISFGIVFYRTYMQVILNDMVVAWWNKYYNSFEHGHYVKNMLLLVTALLFLTLCFGLTLSSAGTFWKTGLDGQKLLYDVSCSSVKFVFGICSILFSFAYIIYNLKNITETMYEIPKVNFAAIKTQFTELVCNYFLTLKSDMFCGLSVSPFFVLPYLLSGLLISTLHITIDFTFLFWNIFTFIGHCISEGVSTDNAFYLSCTSSTLYGTFIELFTDLHYFQHSEEHEKNHVLIKQEDTDERHSNIPAKILCAILSPIIALELLLYKIQSGRNWNDVAALTFGNRWQTNTHHDANDYIPALINHSLWKDELDLGNYNEVHSFTNNI